ncbi:glycosyltransferase family 1 protein [Sphingomonas sp. UYEF23]|uniref:glycosyltransferase family 4 protein n=1 Tax=Sphingomonas sp. UYEF23 TaxID=1756408 RepID=UPI0033985D88
MQATTGRVFVDVTRIARHDPETGIQRVVRAIIREMRAGPRGNSIQAVRWQNGTFRYSSWPQRDYIFGEEMEAGRGDVFLGLDLSFDAVRRYTRQFARDRRSGVRIWFIVYDMLPVELPQFFSSKVVLRFKWWLIATAKVADGYACISQSTADDLGRLFLDRLSLKDRPKLAVIPIGFDSLPHASPTPAVPLAGERPCLLAVGTIEPRKAYGDILSAVDVLWSRGYDVSLTIVGTSGWKTATLQRRLRKHPEFGRRLQWKVGLSDEDLAAMYRRADLLVAASYGEGYGLPVVEAVAHACPVLARDIPVFREHAYGGVRFFDRNANAEQIADAIDAALGCSYSPAAPSALAQWRDTADAVWSLFAPGPVQAETR